MCFDTLSTAVDDALAVQKAIDKVLYRIIEIAQSLNLRGERIEEIERLHKEDSRRAVAVIDTWLRGNFNAKKKPYSLHSEEKYRCPSWWNLVWAVAHKPGGGNPAHAEFIAKNFKSKQLELLSFMYAAGFHNRFPRGKPYYHSAAKLSKCQHRKIQ